MIRPAAFADIPAIVGLLREGYIRSHYGRDGICNIDEREAKRLLVQAIQRHGGTNGGSTWVQVATKDGNIEGFILGTLARVYGIGDRLMATDMFWVASERVDPSDPIRLMRAMIEWASSNPMVVEIKCATNAVIMEDPELPGNILKRLGMTDYGRIYRMQIARK